MKPRKKAAAKLREIRARKDEQSYILHKPKCPETVEQRKTNEMMDRIYIAIRMNVLPSAVHITYG